MWSICMKLIISGREGQGGGSVPRSPIEIVIDTGPRPRASRMHFCPGGVHSEPLRRHGGAPKLLRKQQQHRASPRPTANSGLMCPASPQSIQLTWTHKILHPTQQSSLATRSGQCVQKPSEDELLELYGPPGFKNCKGKWTAASLDSEFKEALCREDQLGGVPRCPAPLMPRHATLQHPRWMAFLSGARGTARGQLEMSTAPTQPCHCSANFAQK